MEVGKQGQSKEFENLLNAAETFLEAAFNFTACFMGKVDDKDKEDALSLFSFPQIILKVKDKPTFIFVKTRNKNCKENLFLQN